MERLVAAIKDKKNALMAINEDEGVLLVMETKGLRQHSLSIYSTSTFDLLSDSPLSLSFPPCNLITRHDWVCFWGDSHSSDHIAVLAISDPALCEVLEPRRVPVLDAKWYPLGEDTLVVLMADFYLRMYDVAWKTTPCLEINIAMRLGYECCPISFAFAGDTEDATFYRFGCFVLQKDGSVYAINPLMPDKAVVEDSFGKLGEAIKNRRLNTVEPRLRDWYFNVLETSTRDLSANYTLSLSPELRQAYQPLPIGPLRPPTGFTYSQLICINPSQPLVFLALRDSGVIDVLLTFADVIPNFTSGKRADTLILLDSIECCKDDPDAKEAESESNLGQFVAMTDFSWMFLTHSKIFELDFHWVSALRRKFETRELHSVKTISTMTFLMTEVPGVHSVVFLHSRPHEKTLLISTGSGVGLQSLGLPVPQSLPTILDPSSISPSEVSKDTLKPKVPSLLPVPNSPQSYIEETTDPSQRLCQLSKVVDQLMETRVIPITKRVCFLLSLLAELKDRHTTDEQSLKEHSECVGTQFGMMVEGIRLKLEQAMKNCQVLRTNIELISQKLNRVYTPLSEEEVEIQGRVRRLHTLTEQLKVEASARKGEREVRVGKWAEIRKCRMRFPCATEVREVMEKLSHMSGKLEDVESQYRSLPS